MSKLKVILMYISEVSGHHSATIAIENSIRQKNPDIEIMNINAFNYTNPISEKIINKLYMSVIKRTPQIWEYLYDNPIVVQKLEKIKKAVHKFNSPKLKNLFDQFQPDAILCSQAFPCGMVADFKKIYQKHIPLVAVLTDYIPHSYWLYDDVNTYVTPSEEISKRLATKGIPEHKIVDLGIPFDPKFNTPQDRVKLTEKFGLKKNLSTILIMGGGQGLGPIKTILVSLNKVKHPIQAIVVCGTNKKLFDSLQSKTHQYKHPMTVLGYARNVEELMSVSDLIITKPGGITSAEVLTKQLPIIIVKPIPGQEANNTSFLTAMGAAVKVDNPEETYRAIDELFLHPDILKLMRLSAQKISKPNASSDIADLLIKHAQEYHVNKT